MILDRFNDSKLTTDSGWLEPVPRESTFTQERRNSPTPVQTIVSYLRLLSDIKRSSQAHTLTPSNIRRFENHLLLLESHCTDINNPLLAGHPGVIHQLSYMLSTKILLWQHALGPTVQQYERTDAIDRLAKVAEATAVYLMRIMQHPGQTKDGRSATEWTEMVRAYASNHFCRHVWRCALINCFVGHWQAAKACLLVSEAIGSMRQLNLACGRNLEHFVDRLSQKMQRSGGKVDFNRDEELIALVSGDMQGDLDNSWIWSSQKESSSTPGSEPSRHDYPFTASTNGSSPAQSRKGSGESGALNATDQVANWNNWARIRQVIDGMERQQNDISRLMPAPRQSPAMSVGSLGRPQSLQQDYVSQRTSPTAGSFPGHPFPAGLPKPYEHTSPSASGQTSPLYQSHPTSPNQQRFGSGLNSFSRPEKHGLSYALGGGDSPTESSASTKRTRLSNSDIPSFNSINAGTNTVPAIKGEEPSQTGEAPPREERASGQDRPKTQPSSGASRISIANII